MPLGSRKCARSTPLGPATPKDGRWASVPPSACPSTRFTARVTFRSSHWDTMKPNPRPYPSPPRPPIRRPCESWYPFVDDARWPPPRLHGGNFWGRSATQLSLVCEYGCPVDEPPVFHSGKGCPRRGRSCLPPRAGAAFGPSFFDAAHLFFHGAALLLVSMAVPTALA